MVKWLSSLPSIEHSRSAKGSGSNPGGRTALLTDEIFAFFIRPFFGFQVVFTSLWTYYVADSLYSELHVAVLDVYVLPQSRSVEDTF